MNVVAVLEPFVNKVLRRFCNYISMPLFFFSLLLSILYASLTMEEKMNPLIKTVIPLSSVYSVVL